MAIHDAVPGIEVTVRIGDQTAQEHEIANDVSTNCSFPSRSARVHLVHGVPPHTWTPFEIFSRGLDVCFGFHLNLWRLITTSLGM